MVSSTKSSYNTTAEQSVGEGVVQQETGVKTSAVKMKSSSAKQLLKSIESEIDREYIQQVRQDRHKSHSANRLQDALWELFEVLKDIQ